MIKLVITIFILLVVPSLYAQEVNQAELYRVEDGVFKLKEGKTIDITDKFLLLAFRRGKKCFEITLNGGHDCIDIGKRIDLKIPYVPFSLGNIFEDRKQCFLDVVGIDAPKGANAEATFRLHCI
jgi:hypothetical protein